MAHANGFKGLVATQGAEGMALAKQHRVDGITLDIQLPVIDGWRVLDRLKNDLDTRHIPVYVITTEEDGERGRAAGILGLLTKPVKSTESLDQVFSAIRQSIERPGRELLLFAADSRREEVAGLLAHSDVRVRAAESAAEALGALDAQAYDSVVLAPGPDRADEEAVAEIVRQCGARDIPVVLFREESGEETASGEPGRREPHVKLVRSLDRLLDQTMLFLHRPIGSIGEEKRRRVEALYSTEGALAGKRVLIVDDDIRNIFAMTSVLERQNMRVSSAETGKEAIEKLQSEEPVDIVLMDVMMPDMDGYDTMRAIRRIGRLRSLPIIAVTAKAMKGDREKTLHAGAWDYLAKPVDTDQMLSVLRAWLYR
jgi:hypothetical protein